jgi:UDP-N-acetylmuramoylalanine--D-glutamate ligase
MSIKEIKNKKIALLGFGIENQALLKYLLKNKITGDITICDKKSLNELPKINKNIKTRLEASFNKNLYEFDIIFRSPGWSLDCPGIREAKNKGTKINSAINLFFEICPSKNIIGVTGTKGKGTTATLLYNIIRANKKSVFLGGNIGIAPFSFIDRIKKDSYVVLELSSFHLEDIKYSPKISVITNIYKEHLSPADPKNPNYHKSYAEYIEAKLNIGRFQKKTDYLIINRSFEESLIAYKKFVSKKILFQKSETPSKLIGNYYKDNVGAAEVVAKVLRIKKSISNKAIAKFTNMEHRLELVRELNGVRYYDNSFSTTPESSILDLNSFENIILLAGGADKGADFKNFAKEIKKRVKYLALFNGLGTNKLLKELKKLSYQSYKLFNSMGKAVIWSNKQANPGDSVILSTGCASFGLFKNYKERGNLFQINVKKL